MQQLRDGTPDFFVTFVRVLRDREGAEPRGRAGRDERRLPRRLPARHPPGAPRERTAVDHPHASRRSTPRSLGLLIALYERAVGLYASLVDINAYHQPGVEAGKKAAAAVLELQRKVVAALRDRGVTGGTCEELARAAGAPEEVETVFHVLERLAANPDRGVNRHPGTTPFEAVYTVVAR